jgi:hypothetical protein
MKNKTALTILLLLASSARAPARKNPARPFFFIPTPVTLAGVEIPEGMYQLTLESSNSSVRVEMWKDGKFVATAKGEWVKNGAKFKDNTILLRVNPDGSRSLIEMRVAGVAKTIVLSSDTAGIVQYSAKQPHTSPGSQDRASPAASY